MGTEGFSQVTILIQYVEVKKDDGTWRGAACLPETRTPLKALADMHAAGELDPEFGIKDGAKGCRDDGRKRVN